MSNFQSENVTKASDLACILKNDGSWLIRQNNPVSLLENIEIDHELASLDACIYLMRNDQYTLSNCLLRRLREKYPSSGLPLYNSALSFAGGRDYDAAINCAQQAIAVSPGSFAARSVLIRVYSLSGAPEKARGVLRGMHPVRAADRHACTILSQFIDLCADFPFASSRSALKLLEESGSYYKPAGCADLILSAIKDNRPFSMVRLGDGEGAWLSLEAYDEGRYASLYRMNRIEFLEDWFGNHSLIDDEKFLSFTRQLQASYFEHDLIGINPEDRINREESLLSIRGITAIINTLRFLNLIGGSKRGLATCSNSVNRGLAVDTSFYRDLFAIPLQFGIITSYPCVRDKLIERGIDIIHDYITPGDSRNFHLTGNGTPECQFPDHFERIDADLASLDLRGKVFLVAAGFVGKRYLGTIKRRGGIALDIGSIVDHWAENGLP